MYEQLLLHLIGDYITQTSWMANKKVEGSIRGVFAAYFHAIVYAIPFMFLGISRNAIIVICISHAIIDHYSLAKYLVFAKNWINEPTLKWKDCSKTGYPNCTPDWLAVWLLIICDNIIHLIINYSAIRWL
jgi:hypothetical protein